MLLERQLDPIAHGTEFGLHLTCATCLILGLSIVIKFTLITSCLGMLLNYGLRLGSELLQKTRLGFDL